VKRVLLADDHPIILSGIETVLRGTGYEVVAKVTDGAAALDALADARPDILILDISMPGGGGIFVLRTLRAHGDMRPVVLLTAEIDDSDLLEAVRLGVNGIVLKEGAQNLLVTCLDAVRDGGRWIEQSLLHRALDLSTGADAGPLARLSEREKAIVALVARGLRNLEVAGELGITEGTVKVYLHRIYEKLGVANRTELAILATGGRRG